MSLPSTLFKLKIGDRFLLRPGSHRVAAELPGYYPLDTRNRGRARSRTRRSR